RWSFPRAPTVPGSLGRAHPFGLFAYRSGSALLVPINTVSGNRITQRGEGTRAVFPPEDGHRGRGGGPGHRRPHGPVRRRRDLRRATSGMVGQNHGGSTTTEQSARQRCLAPVYCLSCAEPLTARRRGRLRGSNGREGVRESPEGGVR